MIPYFSVIPGNSEISVSVSDGTNTYRNQSAIPAKALEAGRYYYLGKTMSTTVAKIGETSYPSLVSAIEAVSVSDATEITLASVTEEDCTIPESKNITLNLDGRTIQGCITVEGTLTVKDVNNTGKIFNDGPCLEVKANGNLTINGGTVETNSSNDNNGATIVINMEGNKEQIDGTIVTFNGGKISQTGTSKRGAIDAKYSTITFPNTSTTVIKSKERAFVSGAGVKLTIGAGSFKSDDSYTIFLNNGTNGSAVINGGNFDGGTYCFQIYGTSTDVQINDGKHKWNNANNFLSLASSAKGSQLTIQGGKFMKSVSSYVPDGFACLDNEDDDKETYAKKVAECKILVGTNICQNYTDAMTRVNDAEEDITMTLYDSITLSANDSLFFTNDKEIKITLNLNGKEIKSTESKNFGAVVVTKAKSLTISDTDGKGKINQSTASNYNCALSVRGGECNIISGSILREGAKGYPNRNAISANGKDAPATLNIYGGTISAVGRVITFGSGNSSRKVYVNISGGLIKSTEDRLKTNSADVIKNENFALVRSVGTYGYLTITGGTFVANYQPILYLGSVNSKITIDEGENGKIAYFYQEYPDYEATAKETTGGLAVRGCLFMSGTQDGTAVLYDIQNCYSNAKNVNYTNILKDVTQEELTTPEKDTDGREYTYHLYKSSSN